MLCVCACASAKFISHQRSVCVMRLTVTVNQPAHAIAMQCLVCVGAFVYVTNPTLLAAVNFTKHLFRYLL